MRGTRWLRRPLWFLGELGLLLCGLESAGGQSPRLEFQLVPEKTTVEQGEGFELNVIRSWEEGWVPSEWTELDLFPLSVVLLGEERRVSNRRIEETFLYRAFAFALDELVIPELTLTAKGPDGAILSTTVPELRFRVERLLDPGAPGAVELPGDLLPEPAGSGIGVGAVVLLAAASVIVGLVFVRRFRHRSGVAPTTVLSASDRARSRLEALTTKPALEGAFEADFTEASSLLRDYLEEKYSVSTQEKTTEELLLACDGDQRLADPVLSQLSRSLRRCDVLRFAPGEPTARDREELFDELERFLGTCEASVASRGGGS